MGTEVSGASKLKGAALKFLTLAFVALLLYWTVGDKMGPLKDVFATAAPGWVAVALLLYLIPLTIQFLRWHHLLRLQEIDLNFREVFALHMSGVFFNTTTPGAVSGDLLKVAAVMKKSPDNKPAAVMSIMVDRLIGLAALLIFVLMLFVPAFDFIRGQGGEKINLAVISVVLGSMCGVIAFALVLLRRRLHRLPWCSKLVTFVERKAPHLYFAFHQVEGSFDMYQKKWKDCLVLLVLSIISHLFLGLSFYALGLALGLSISPLLFILSIQVSNALAGFLPLPGGLGLRDTIGKSILMAAGCSELNAAAAPLLYSGVILFWAFVGGLIFLLWRYRRELFVGK
ncbi:MAG: flippase-like domain-containing protein [Lentisphaeraceae bacterium]|nr:flippase-like domain-containing protein [Lentisphaeraceae bacterium]